jgi:hypothetical protein
MLLKRVPFRNQVSCLLLHWSLRSNTGCNVPTPITCSKCPRTVQIRGWSFLFLEVEVAPLSEIALLGCPSGVSQSVHLYVLKDAHDERFSDAHISQCRCRADGILQGAWESRGCQGWSRRARDAGYSWHEFAIYHSWSAEAIQYIPLFSTYSQTVCKTVVSCPF